MDEFLIDKLARNLFVWWFHDRLVVLYAHVYNFTLRAMLFRKFKEWLTQLVNIRFPLKLLFLNISFFFAIVDMGHRMCSYQYCGIGLGIYWGSKNLRNVSRCCLASWRTLVIIWLDARWWLLAPGLILVLCKTCPIIKSYILVDAFKSRH